MSAFSPPISRATSSGFVESPHNKIELPSSYISPGWLSGSPSSSTSGASSSPSVSSSGAAIPDKSSTPSGSARSSSSISMPSRKSATLSAVMCPYWLLSLRSFSFASASFSASTYTQGSAGISSPSACIFFNAASLPCPSSTWFISSCAHTKNGNEKPCFLMLLIILFMSTALRCFNAP